MAGQHLIGESVVQDLPQNSWFEFSITFFVELTPSSTLLHYDASSIHTRAGTLLWVYRQYIAMPYIALARQAWIYRDISDSLGTRLESRMDYEVFCSTYHIYHTLQYIAVLF